MSATGCCPRQERSHRCTAAPRSSSQSPPAATPVQGCRVEARMPDLPWYPWWPRHAAESFAGLPDLIELALRRALDASWSAGFHGVGTLEQWLRWGRLEARLEDPILQKAFVGEIKARCQVQPDGETWVHMRMISCLGEQMAKAMRHQAAGRSSAVSRGERVYRPAQRVSTGLEHVSTTRSRSRDKLLPPLPPVSPPSPPPDDFLTGPLPWERD